jgi:hypothetical protein
MDFDPGRDATVASAAILCQQIELSPLCGVRMGSYLTTELLVLI